MTKSRLIFFIDFQNLLLFEPQRHIQMTRSAHWVGDVSKFERGRRKPIGEFQTPRLSSPLVGSDPTLLPLLLE